MGFHPWKASQLVEQVKNEAEPNTCSLSTFLLSLVLVGGQEVREDIFLREHVFLEACWMVGEDDESSEKTNLVQVQIQLVHALEKPHGGFISYADQLEGCLVVRPLVAAFRHLDFVVVDSVAQQKGTLKTLHL